MQKLKMPDDILSLGIFYVKKGKRMREFDAGNYDVAVIGAGHAGCEAALAAARLGMHTIMFSINLDAIANLPCNPSIGGTAKGHLVREIDALGGEMGKAADKNCIQSKMLNVGKGPAVHSLRAQIDRVQYKADMKHRLEQQENLTVRQGEVVEVAFDENHAVESVLVHTGGRYHVRAVIVATGTYLGGKIIMGETMYPGGPDGMFAATRLTESLQKAGVELVRFKTGTPPRLNGNSIDFSCMEREEGDEHPVPFSFETKEPPKNVIPCYLGYTNETMHQIIRDNLDRAPMYSGQIKGIGPRYCPSIEDKVVRFKEKKRHQLFVEPMGVDTCEMYLQGMSTSLPEEVQNQMYRTIKGLEHVEIMRNAYAIEYDCCDPTQLYPTLEFKKFPGLYGAGQFNGTSGYEEAACQGLIAGINAALRLRGDEPLILKRSDAYIGTLIDDLVTKGTNEPYRMMTSRSEYRLLLRQDNADERLTPIGHAIGLISEERYQAFCRKQEKIRAEVERVSGIVVSPKVANPLLQKYQSTPVKTGIRMGELLRRPEITYDALAEIDPDRPENDFAVREQVQIRIKYEGYIRRQLAQVEQFKKMENKLLPADIDYNDVYGLRIEARQKLNKQRPASVGQASRISGVSPADISVLLIWLEANGGRA